MHEILQADNSDRDAFTPSHTVGFAKFIRLFAQLYQELAYVEAEGDQLKESTGENMWTVVDIEASHEAKIKIEIYNFSAFRIDLLCLSHSSANQVSAGIN